MSCEIFDKSSVAFLIRLSISYMRSYMLYKISYLHKISYIMCQIFYLLYKIPDIIYKYISIKY